MDYSQFSNTDNIVNEFTTLIRNDEKLAIGYMDNLLGILLSKKIYLKNLKNPSIKDSDNMLFYAIREGKEKLVLKIVDSGVIEPNFVNDKGQNALFFATFHNQYKIAIKLLDTGFFDPEQTDKDGFVVIDIIEFHDNIDTEEQKNDKLELLIKLLDYYIKNNITSNQNFQETIDYICSEQILIYELNNKLKRKKSMNININRFKEFVNLDNPELLCAQPINAETGAFVNDLNVFSNSEPNSNLLKAKNIKMRTPAIALPDTEEYFDENEYEPEEETEFLLPPRKRLGAGKNKSKKMKQQNKTKNKKIKSNSKITNLRRTLR